MVWGHAALSASMPLSWPGVCRGLAVPCRRRNQWGVTVTRGHTGRSAQDIKTYMTDVDPAQYIADLPWERRVRHGRQLLEVFSRATGSQPRMWGPSMIGYGQTHYESASARHGDWFLVGFSPRQATISFYGMKNFPELLARLSSYSEGTGCLYVNKIKDIDLGVLEDIIVAEWNRELG